MSRYWRRFRRLIVHNLLHADDTPHSIALGASIAVFVAVLPLLGIQMLLAVALAALVRANKAICLPVVWVSNPITMVPIYGGCLALGRMVMSWGPPDAPAAALAELAEPAQTASWVELEFWTNLLARLPGMGVELWVGCVLVGVVAGAITYPLMRWLVTSYRAQRRQRGSRRKVYRAEPGSNPLCQRAPVAKSSTRKSEVA